MGKTIDAKFLKGLIYRTAEAKKIKGEDGVKVQHIPRERNLRPADVLDYALTGAGLVTVAGDGQKHTVEISAAERKELAAAEAAEPEKAK